MSSSASDFFAGLLEPPDTSAPVEDAEASGPSPLPVQASAGAAGPGEPVVLFEPPPEPAPSAPAPEPVDETKTYSNTTPSGTVVEYQAKPKRLYRVNGVEVPSVTTVLKVLDKPALPWWGMKVGVDGLLELYRRKLVTAVVTSLENYDVELANLDKSTLTVDNVIDLLKQHKLTTNHVLDRAGDRGVNVHDAFETWAATGLLPDPNDYPDTERGYVEGLCCFLVDAMPEPLEAEVMVGSAEHGFAGRYDIRLELPDAASIVFHRTPVRGPQYDAVAPGKYLCDLKTSKDVYPGTHFRQLEAYEHASVECGYEPTDARYVIHVSPDGTYKFVRSIATFDDYLAVLGVWRSNERLKGAK